MIDSLTALVITAALSGAVTYFGAKRKLELDYDADLRQRRIDAYANLWTRLAPLAKYSAPASFTQDDASALAASLRTWYFHKGGIFLSVATRNDYFALQDLLLHVTGEWGGESPGSRDLSPGEREYLRVLGSRLRSSLTIDVGTRSRPKFRGEVQPVDRTSAEGTYKREDGRKLELKFTSAPFRRTPPSVTAIGKDGTTKPVDVQDWDSARGAMRLILDDPDRKGHERVVLIEPGKLVEGPRLDEKGSEPPAEKGSEPPAVWKRVTEPPGGGGT